MSHYKIYGALLVVCALIFSINLSLKYAEYLEFLKTEQINARVISAKNMLKLSGANLEITSRAISDVHEGDLLQIRLYKSNLDFASFLGSRVFLNIISYKKLASYENSLYKKALRFISSQHTSSKMQQFYGALFLAAPISAELRNDVNYYAIAHLLAISGYHLGLIYALVYFVLKFILKRFKNIRAISIDLVCASAAFVILGAYFLLIGQVPSFFRAFMMACLALVFKLSGLKIFSFKSLFLAIFACISIQPGLLFNIGFGFSALGVFYIYVYARHFNKQPIKINYKFRTKLKSPRFERCLKLLKLIGFEAYIFLAMIIPVLVVFPLISPQQVLALVLTPSFVLFYPLAAFLHLINCGGLLDGLLLNMLDFKLVAANLFIGFGWLWVYLMLSLLAVFYKIFAYLIALLNFALLLIASWLM